MSQFSEEEIAWRNGLREGDFVDAVKHEYTCSMEMWSRAEISSIYGNCEKNLGEVGDDKVNRFDLKFFKDSSSKMYRADSLEIAQFDSKASEDF